jgi:DNA-directed RNA polymerase subunit E'/Rpb7
MFVLEVLRVVITLPSSALLPNDIPAAIGHEIDSKYPNRVIENVGLIIATRVPISSSSSSSSSTVLRISHGVCVHGETAFPVEFSALVFRPMPLEILTGEIVEMNERDGIRVSIGFFANIWIPKHNLLHPSRYEHGVWVWIPEYDDDDDKNDHDENEEERDAATANGLAKESSKKEQHPNGGLAGAGTDEEEATRYEMNLGSPIRFRVQQVLFPKPIRPKTPTTIMTTTTTTDVFETASMTTRRSSYPTVPSTSAMQIVASICEDGLGLIDWWKESGEEQEEEEIEKAEKATEDGEEFIEEDAKMMMDENGYR